MTEMRKRQLCIIFALFCCSVAHDSVWNTVVLRKAQLAAACVFDTYAELAAAFDLDTYAKLAAACDFDMQRTEQAFLHCTEDPCRSATLRMVYEHVCTFTENRLNREKFENTF